MHMAIEARRWTLEEMHALPEDGNHYELIDGELLVSRAPAPRHEGPAARLARLLDRYIVEQRLDVVVYRPQSVFRIERRVEVEPDLQVRPELDETKDWEYQALPILVVEVHSPRSKRADLTKKRDVYMNAGIPEYWTVDPDERTVSVHRYGQEPARCDVSVIASLRGWTITKPPGLGARPAVAGGDDTLQFAAPFGTISSSA